jgi:hypothetical protein
VQEIFINSEYLKSQSSYNPELGKQYEEDYTIFAQIMQNCAEKSNKESLINKNSNSSLKFFIPQHFHKLVIEKILKQNKDVTPYERMEDFKNWFNSTILSERQGNNNNSENI